jgi:hypothetical protein
LILLQHWLLQFGEVSSILRNALVKFIGWLANHTPPWVAYLALMSGHLLGLNKLPGVQPVGVGEVWHHLAGEEAKEACGIVQLCAGLEAGIKGGIHMITKLWQQMKEDNDWGFLLIDVSDAFSEMNWTAMQWHIRHKWPSGTRYTFSCYPHWSILVIRGVDGTTSSFINSKERVTQGNTLSMVPYGIGVLPLICRLKQEFLGVKPP